MRVSGLRLLVGLTLATGGSALALHLPADAATVLETTVTAPAANATIVPKKWPAVTFAGTASGPQGVTSVDLAIKKQGAELWLQDDGSMGATKDWRTASGTTSWQLSVTLPADAFEVWAKSRNGASGDTTPAKVPFTVAARDPLLWPYPTDSFWNLPRATSAQLTPLGMLAPQSTFPTITVDEDLLFLQPGMPSAQWREIDYDDAGWADGEDRCDDTDDAANTPDTITLGTDDEFPLPLLLAGAPDGTKPNAPAAIVMPDNTLRETQPLTQCGSGASTFFTSKTTRSKHQGDSIVTGGHGPNANGTAGGGAHGGSSMTALGGAIRVGEWVPGGNIPHATKMELYTAYWLSKGPDGNGYRWPALDADSHWNNSANPPAGEKPGYGTLRPGGPPPISAEMGVLLTLPNSFDLTTLESEPARILARSIKNYGTYVVDGAGRDAVQFATEWSANGRVRDDFASTNPAKGWGFPLKGRTTTATGAQRVFLLDMEDIYESLKIVVNNGPSTPGGGALGAARMTQLAPPL